MKAALAREPRTLPVAQPIASPAAILILTAAAAATIFAPRLNTAARIAPTLPVAGVAAFALFGLLASREPGTSPIWFAIYAATLLACSIAIIRLALAPQRTPS